ncbi:amidohydrolase family protein [Nocardioides sp. YIM B13467]|uniref:amidohydrolase family protein n=1 Tax=Nocardioides sp. YIM B13467 TaxID=3366294 RepID=UPI00366AC289
MNNYSNFAQQPAGSPSPSVASAPGNDLATRDALIANNGDRAVLIKGGTILTQDASHGNLESADVLIRDGKIAELGVGLDDADAIVVDASAMIVLPGFVDSHVHAWEGQLRGSAPTLDFGSYLGYTAFGYGPLYRPHDSYVGNLITSLVALDSGITTIIDNSHNSLTPDHSSAAVEGLRDAGIRAVHAVGAPVAGPPENWPKDVLRLRSEYFSSNDQLLTLRLFDLYPSAELWEFARSEGLWVSHEMGAHIENVDDVFAELSARGLLTAQHTYNHCFDLSDKVWEMLRESGASVNLAPRSDAAFGLGTSTPPIDKVREMGIIPGLSGDNEVSYGLSMFAEMQILLNGHRGRTFRTALVDGADAAPEHLTPEEVLTYATMGGAANAGLADRVGSLTPGKAADVVLVRATDVNTAPLSNPVATVTAFTHAGNVDTVFVAGSARKFRGELLHHDFAQVRALVEASRDFLFEANAGASEASA